MQEGRFSVYPRAVGRLFKRGGRFYSRVGKRGGVVRWGGGGGSSTQVYGEKLYVSHLNIIS